MPTHDSTVSALDGRFRLIRLADAEYEVSVRPPPGFCKPSPVIARAGAEDVVIELVRGQVVKLAIVDPAGKPVEGARVQLQPCGEQGGGVDGHAWLQAHADSEGVATIEGVDPDLHYALGVYPPSTREKLNDFEIRVWKPESREIRLDAGHTVTVSVLTRDGKPIAGARVSLQPLELGEDEWVSTTRTNTSESGTCTFTRLEPGAYEVSALLFDGGRRSNVFSGQTEGTRATPKRVQVGKESSVTLVIDPPTGLRVYVAGWERRFRRVEAVVTPEGGEPRRAQIDRDGTVEFEDLPWDAELSLWIGPVPDDRHVHRTGLFTSETELEVELMAGREVSGRVRFPKGSRDRRVWLALPGVNLDAKVGGDGRFKIASVPSGTWRVHAAARVGEQEVSADVAADAEQPVEIDLRE